MTSEDHDTGALIAALRSPALPREQIGEAADVAAMVEALPTAAPARPGGLRSRRGVAVAAVTVASLGVGGLVAAGPGFFSPLGGSPADPAEPTDPAIGTERLGPLTGTSLPGIAVAGSTAGQAASSGADTDGGELTPADGPAEIAVDEPGVSGADCVGDTHGATVSDVARTSLPDEADPARGVAVSEAARSDCGRPETPANTAPGQTGDTPANTAPGQTGDTPASPAVPPADPGPNVEPPAPPAAQPTPPTPPTPPTTPTPPTPPTSPAGGGGGGGGGRP